MDALFSLFQTYSLPVLALGFMLGMVGVILKLSIEKAIANAFSLHAKRLEAELNFQSAFRQRVLLDRYEAIGDLATRLQRVMAMGRRYREGGSVGKGHISQKTASGRTEIVPLTEILEDLHLKRAVLTDEFFSILNAQAQLAVQFFEDPSIYSDADQWQAFGQQWSALQNTLHDKMNQRFGLAEIWL